MTRDIPGLGAIADRFDAVLVDQYGVLHDGTRAFAGAREALEALAARDCPVVAITNSGKPAEANLARLAELSFPRTLFAALVASGELARAEITRRLADGTLPPGASVALVSRGSDGGLLEGLDLRVAPPEASPDAALLLIAGLEPERISRAEYRAMLSPLARRSVPALCANPDRLMHVADGAADGPGLIAADYAEAGGSVTYLGKPASALFEAALGRLGNPDPRRVLMIGDSPAHDIAGAAALGLLTCLVRGGVQAGLDGGVEADFALNELCW